MTSVATRSYNIDVLARSRRMRFGLLVYSLGLVAAVVLVDSSLHAGWRGLTFVPFMVGSLSIFQAAFAICPMRAARGELETNAGVHKILNPEQRAHDRRRAAAVFSTSIAVASLTTAILFLLP